LQRTQLGPLISTPTAISSSTKERWILSGQPGAVGDAGYGPFVKVLQLAALETVLTELPEKASQKSNGYS
jgi:hypothetical protein